MIEFANTCYLFGYPVQLGGGATTTFTGDQWSVNGPCTATHGMHETYAQALTDAKSMSTTVKDAYIVADGDQTPGTTDTVTGMQYGGKTLVGSAPSGGKPGGGKPGKGGQPGSQRGSGYVVNAYSGKCPDAANVFGSARTTTLQIWSCGAARGVDQHFAYSGHTLRYVARNGNDRYCVSEPRRGDRALLLAPCDNASTQYVTYDHGTYKYRDGRVLDDKSFGTNDGNPVLVWAYNGGKNQLWTLPK